MCLTGATVVGSELVLDGEFAQGGLIRGHTEPGAEVRLDGRTVRVSADGRFLLGFGRDAASSASLAVIMPNGQVENHKLPVRSREYQIQRIDGLPDKMVTPGAADLARIRAEQAQINAARHRDTVTPYFTSGFVWPANGIISGCLRQSTCSKR